MTEAKLSMIRQNAHNVAVEYNQKQNIYMTIFDNKSKYEELIEKAK